MRCNLKYLSRALLALSPFAFSMAEEEDPGDIFPELIDIVIHSSVPGYDDSKMTDDVLDFLTAVYSDHSYNETGAWVKAQKGFLYQAPKGDLPLYDNLDFRIPSLGRITSGFGFRPKFGRMHKGIDIALNEGDTVRSALPGIVTGIGFDPDGYGNYMVVSHSNDLQTLYGHLHSVVAGLGDIVKAGEAIALGGKTGNSTGPHLHFETRRKGEPFDPSLSFGIAKQ